MNVLSLQSWVACGHVGNTAAAFALQRLGVEVCAVPTVLFSNHAGYPTVRGRTLAPATVSEIVRGVGERGVFADCAAVLSGYLGDAGMGDTVLDAVGRVKAANGGALYACDPVMGDAERGFYVGEAIAEFFRERALPAADIVTPNQFELALLTGRTLSTLDDILDAATALRRRGPRIVLVTSLVYRGLPEDTVEVLASDATGQWLVRTPILAKNVAGAGDLFAALFLAHHLKGATLPQALGRAVSGLYGLLRATCATGRGELAMVAAQDELVTPSQAFPARRVG